ncbi:hypothetical protein K402DRAFT_418198 [Aulographum hederae CBS 113979]|uniref:Uncharacterized protein n=1 Tax=Aulographum hederae CBS 113979 TaxID=1176131 RepID=A0A6G1HAS2_9PEZI|nr:hypothetical protein K402DRAFT_418198 [Aulographum hederae CBS 113979]
MDLRPRFNSTYSEPYEDELSGTEDGQKSIFTGLILEKVQSVRYQHLAMGGLSLALGLAVASRILYDSWKYHKLTNKPGRRKYSWIWRLHPAEIAPMFFAIGIMWEEFAFIGIQTHDLHTIFVRQCPKSGQVIFPNIFIVGWMHFVLGAETAIRALRKDRFLPRKRWTPLICLTIVTAALFATWVPTLFIKNKGKCLGDIISRAERYGAAALPILIFIMVGSIIMMIIIAVQLSRTVKIEPKERVAASRMVYYLIASVLHYAFLAPFFVGSVTPANQTVLVTTTRIADFTLFAAGILFAGLYLFLRTNGSLTAIKPADTPWDNRRSVRIFGPNDLEDMAIAAPTPLMEERNRKYYEKDDSDDAWSPEDDPLDSFRFPAEKSGWKSSPSGEQQVENAIWPLPAYPLPAPTSATQAKTPHDIDEIFISPKTRQSLTPLVTAPPKIAGEVTLLPSTVYTPQSKIARKSFPAPPPSTTGTTGTAITNNASTVTSSSPGPASSTSASPYTDFSASSPLLSPPKPFFARTSNGSSRTAYQGHRRSSSADSCATVQIGLRLSMSSIPLASPRSSGSGSNLPGSPVTVVRKSPLVESSERSPIREPARVQTQATKAALQNERAKQQKQQKLRPQDLPALQTGGGSGGGATKTTRTKPIPPTQLSRSQSQPLPKRKRFVQVGAAVAATAEKAPITDAMNQPKTPKADARNGDERKLETKALPPTPPQYHGNKNPLVALARNERDDIGLVGGYGYSLGRANRGGSPSPRGAMAVAGLPGPRRRVEPAPGWF